MAYDPRLDYLERVRAVRTLVLLVLLIAATAQPASAAAPFTPWCGGTEEAAADRQPDAIGAFQIHVVYAIPSDGADRFAERVSAIATDAASIDAWWRAQDAGRTPRFDLHAFPGCTSAFGGLDVTFARLPHDSGYYWPLAARYMRIQKDLNAPPFGLADPDKKYLVYYDGPSEEGRGICGESNTGLIEGGPDAYSMVYLAGLCSAGFGASGAATTITAHELIHGLNALAYPTPTPGPPNACPGDRGHPCDSPRDILAQSQYSDVVLDTLALDVGRDDYYGHSGSWWDVQDSPFLSRLDSPDTSPPTAPAELTATSVGGFVTLTWGASRDDVGPVSYRVYRDGDLLARTGDLSFGELAEGGKTNAYAVRAADAAGFLSERQTIRFTVGLGIVDGEGKLLRDTVPPPVVQGLRARRTATSLFLSWLGTSDSGGLKGYRVERNGAFYALVTRPRLTVPARKARALWRVRALDLGGNLGPPAVLRVRR